MKDGLVAVNGTAVHDVAFKADVERDEISVRGKPIRNRRHIYIMLNKPAGVISASRGAGDTRKTVTDLVPVQMRRQGLFPAGRLDADSTGFVLITDDGDFAHRILSPSSHVEKTYVVTLSRPVDMPSYAKAFSDGVTLADGTRLLSADIKMISDGDMPTAEVVLREGKYHQIKRMFAALGNHVQQLKRTKIGGLELDAFLTEGECRELTDEEKSKIIQSPDW